MYKSLSAPLVVQIELTELCPNSCIHCYNYWRHEEHSVKQFAQLTLAQIQRVMDELERTKVFLVVITGGEPMMNKPVMYEILDRVENSDFMYATINSSLIGMTAKDAKRLKKYTRLTGVLTSLMGPNASIHDEIAKHPGAFSITVAGMQRLIEQNIPTSVNMVLSKFNQGYIMETAARAKDLGVKSFNVTRATCPSNCSDFTDYALDVPELRTYLQTLKEAGRRYDLPVGVLTVYPLCAIRETGEYGLASGRTCSAGITVAVVSSRGEVRACTHLEKVYGQLLHEPFDTIWQRMDEWRDGSLIPTVCQSCKALAICGGGCRAEAIVATHSLKAEDPLMCLEDVDYALQHFQESRQMLTPINLPDRVVCNPIIRWRVEEFGVVCYLRKTCAGILNADVAQELLYSNASTPLNVVDLTERFSTKVVDKLIWKGILIPYVKEVSKSAEYDSTFSI